MDFGFVIGSKDCPISEVVKTFNSHPYFFHFTNNWSEFAYLLGTPSDAVIKLRRDFILDKIGLYDCHYAILELWIGRVGDDATIEKLISELEGMGLRDCRDPLSSSIFTKFSSRPSFSWSELTQQVQEYIVLKATHQTGFEFNLEDYQHVFSTLDCSVLKQLIAGEKVQLFKESLPEDISYYVSRRVVPRTFISNDIFSEKSGKDIFLFANLEMAELYKMAGKETTGYSKDYLDYPEVRFMILNEHGHFDMICKRTTENVHLLEKEGALLKWRKTIGKIEVLQECQVNAHDYLLHDILAEVGEDSPVIISDTAGMGKSTLLAKIGRSICEINPSILVSFVAFTDFIRKVKNFSSESDIGLKEKIKSVLATTNCLNSLGRRILRSKLNQDEKQIELLLDGFDEICSEDSELAFEILNSISSFKCLRVWVTSRPQFLHELEDVLNTLGFHLFPFNRQEQIDFFVSYWSRSKSMDELKLKSFSEICLDTLNSRLSNRDKEITGIPLQCLMIGEVFEDYLGFENAEVTLTSSIRSIADLYQHFIDSKFKKYKRLHGMPDAWKKMLLNVHARQSLELIFENSSKIEQIFGEVCMPHASILDVGILEKWSGVNQPSKFIHRSFAEYLAAWFLVQKFDFDDDREEVWTQNMADFFFFEVLDVFSYRYADLYVHQFNHSLVCHFLNSLLVDFNLKDRNLEWFRNTEIFLEKAPFIKICYAAVGKNYWGIFRFLDEINAFGGIEEETFSESFLEFSIEFGDIQIFERVLRHFENNHKFSKLIKTRILEKTLKKGNFLITQFLLKNKDLDELAKTSSRPLYHYVVENTIYEAVTVLEQRKDIIHVLYLQDPALIELADEQGRTALVSDFVHFELLQELVKLGADILAKDQNGDTVLHARAGSNRAELDNEQLQKLLETMQKHNEPSLRELLQTEGGDQLKPLNTYFFRTSNSSSPAKETIELAVRMGVNLNELDKDGNTLLSMAIRNNMSSSIETLQTLVKLGADANWKHHETSDTLVHLAAFNCNPQILILLLDDYKLGVNDINLKANSPLDVVANAMHLNRYRIPNAVESAMELIRRGGRGMKASLNSILHHTIAFGEEDAVKYLIFKREIGIKKKRWELLRFGIGKRTPPTWIEEGNYSSYLLRIFSNLLEAKINMKEKGLGGKTLMHVLMEKYPYWDPELLHLFLEMLTNHNLCHLLAKRDIKGRTPIHKNIQAQNITFKTLNLLNKTGIDLRIVSYWSGNLLYEAVSDGESMDVLTSLVAFKADLDNVDEMGNGLLHACCQSLNVEAMHFLLGLSKLDVNLKNEEEQTPLHLAVLNYWQDKKSLMEIILMLLRNGAEYSDIFGYNGYELKTDIDISNPNKKRLNAKIEQAAARLGNASDSSIYSNYRNHSIQSNHSNHSRSNSSTGSLSLWW